MPIFQKNTKKWPKMAQKSGFDSCICKSDKSENFGQKKNSIFQPDFGFLKNGKKLKCLFFQALIK